MPSDPKSSIPAVARPPEARRERTIGVLRSAWLGSAACLLGGCSLRGAPSYSIFGAYFPAWLLCAGIGIAGSIGLRSVFVATGLESTIPLRLLVYVSFATMVALSIWLLLFRMS